MKESLGRNMKNLDDDARKMVEKYFHGLLESPKITEETYSFILITHGIKSDLETVLGYITGVLTGYVESLYSSKYNRLPNPYEKRELSKLLEKWVSKLRDSLSSRG